MGVNPDLDDDVEILNPNFDDASVWVIDVGWVIAAGRAKGISSAPVDGTMRQNIGCNLYFRYRLTFTLSNVDILNPLTEGLKISLGGTLSGIYSANGTFTFEAVATDASGDLIFISFNMAPFKEFFLDTLILVKLENYVEDELDIFAREPKQSSTVVAVASDYYTSLSSRDDNTSCLISYDI
ncbi:hypothetical protein KAR91_05280 [Candidatus Pacearchaeota archaeon]|nr:hypothetical protein [Candidatus Pacearchaeota archaeon]